MSTGGSLYKNLKCSIDKCSKPRHGKWRCSKHEKDYRLQKYGIEKKSRPLELNEYPKYIENWVDKTSNSAGCWLWKGYKNKHGYGIWTRGGGFSHRRIYEYLIGEIPEGLQLDHLCRNPPCCNPQHLEPVTAYENQYRSPISFVTLNSKKTHCPQGHEYNEENTYIRPNGHRKCKACNRERWH